MNLQRLLVKKITRYTRANKFNMTTANNINGDNIEKCKAIAAHKAVEENINGDCTVGVGSGSTMLYVLEKLKQLCDEQKYKIKCIPTSLQSKQLIYDYKLPISEINCDTTLDITIDGADEMDENFVAIKGGGACLAQEKIVAYAAKKFIIVADYRKNSKHLGDNWTKGIPIEVIPMACNAVRQNISKMFNVSINDILIRIGKEKAGPVITDNGNLIIDWKFNTKETIKNSSSEWKALADKIKLIPGVVETGIFAGMINKAYFGQTDGKVLIKEAAN